MEIVIRQEHPNDYIETQNVVKKAFADVEMSSYDEHELVERLRKSDAFVPELSLVAVDQEQNAIIGHIILTKIKIKGHHGEVDSLALAPVSVLPGYQKRGIGSQLCLEALRVAKAHGFESVFVLGHPAYYPRFGFEKASDFDIQPPFDVPDEVFMALELKEDALSNVSGVIEYSSAFDG